MFKWPMVLMYHSIVKKRNKPSSFYHVVYFEHLARQLKFLNRICRFLTPEQFQTRIENGDSFRWNEVLLTFDDGYENNFNYLPGLLKEVNIEAIIFCNTINLDKKMLWFNKLKILSQRGIVDWEYICEQFHNADIATINKTLAAIVDDNIGYTIPEVEQCVGAEQSQISNAAQKNITIGGHTVSHCKLVNESSDTQISEIDDNKSLLEQLTRRELKYFAYPEGLVNTSIAEKVKRAGYKYAFVVESKLIIQNSLQNYFIPRLGIYRGSIFYLIVKILLFRFR